MSHFLFAPLFAGFVNLALVAFVGTRRQRSRSLRVLLWFAAALSVWNFGAALMLGTASGDVARYCARVLHLGVVFLPALFLDLAVTLSHARLGRWRDAGYAVAFVLAGINMTPHFIADVRRLSYGWYASPGWAYWLFVLFLPAAGALALGALLGRRRHVTGAERRELTLLSAAGGVLLLVGSHDVLPVLGVEQYPGTLVAIYPWGTLISGGFGLVVAYAILQDEFLDVRVAFSRGVANAVRILFLLCLAFVFLFVLVVPIGSTKPGVVLPAAMIGMAGAAVIASLLFPRLFGEHVQRLERRIVGDTFDHAEKCRRQIESLDEVAERDSLVALTHDLVLHRLRIDAYVLLLLDPSDGAVRTRVGHGVSDLERWDAAHPAFRARSGQPSEDPGGLPPYGPLRTVWSLATTGKPFGLLALGRAAPGSFRTVTDEELIPLLIARLGRAAERLWLAEQAQAAARLAHVALMSRGLAHDLANLLAPITTLLRHTAPLVEGDSRALELHEHASKSMAAMRQYVRDAMFLGEQQPISPQQVSYVQLCATVQDLTAERCRERGVQLAVMVWGAPMGVADPLLVQRLLTNLVHNAADASAPGQTVRLAVEPRGSAVVLRVTDEGSGIAPSDLARVFDPYFTTKQNGETRGFGLGLAISRRVVELHRGRIALQSERGKGTTVTVELPSLYPCQEGSGAAAQPATTAGGEAVGQAGLPVVGAAKRPRVTICDDQPGARAALRAMLEDEFECTAVATADELLSLVEHHRYDCAIVDWSVGSGGGDDDAAAVALLHQLRQRDPLLPLVVWTAADRYVHGRSDLPADTSVLAKPVDADDARQAVRRAACLRATLDRVTKL